MIDRKRDLGAIARTIVDSNLYMTLATADENGRPWASPVYASAVAEELSGADLDWGIGVFSRASVAEGANGDLGTCGRRHPTACTEPSRPGTGC